MPNKINILFSSFPDFSGNPKALYEYIAKNYSEKFELIWVIYNEDSSDILKNINVKFVLYKSQEYEQIMQNIDIIFDTNGELLREKRENQIYVNMWHGSSPKKKGYLLPIENFAEQDTDYYELAQMKTDFVLVPSEFAQLIFSSVFNINSQNVLPLGYPRDEYLLKSDGKANLQKFTSLNLEKFNKIIFYLPTFRNGCNRKDSKNIFEDNILNIKHYEESELIKFLEQNNFLLVMKKHPTEMNEINEIKSENILILNEEELQKENITIYEILNSADLLIADYSSVYVEYLLLERPVLFLHQDIKEYTKNRGIILQDSNIWFPGPTALNLEELKNNILELLNNNTYYQKERQNFRNLMFNKDVSNIAKDIFEYFFDTNTFKIKHKPYASIISKLSKKNMQLVENEEKDKEQIDLLNKQNYELSEELTKLYQERDIIFNSRSWKLFNLVQKIKKGVKK